MLPGLHPGLLMAAAAKLVIEDLPQSLYISTGGGPGNRQLGLAVTVKNGVGPYTFEWEITLMNYLASPSSGAGTQASDYVSFTTNVYVDGGLSDYREEGVGYLRVWDAAGNFVGVQVPVYAGQ